jgi:hypothetical protein
MYQNKKKKEENHKNRQTSLNGNKFKYHKDIVGNVLNRVERFVKTNVSSHQ